MIGSAFFVYYICSLGIFFIYHRLNQMIREKTYQKLFLFSLLFFIFAKNFYDYFFVYPKTLPNQNVAYGKIITDDIKKENKKYLKIVYGCCWGEWGQPEPKSILNYLEDKIDIYYFDFFETSKLCNFIENKNNILIYTKDNIEIDCLSDFEIDKINKDFYQKILIKNIKSYNF